MSLGESASGDDKKDPPKALLPIAILLTLLAAFILACSLVTQRYALSYPEPRVPIWRGRTLSRFGAWFCGLLLYGVANGIKVFALNLGPLAVLASCFTMVR